METDEFGFQWYSDLDGALKQADEEQKPVLLYFHKEG